VVLGRLRVRAPRLPSRPRISRHANGLFFAPPSCVPSHPKPFVTILAGGIFKMPRSSLLNPSLQLAIPSVQFVRAAPSSPLPGSSGLDVPFHRRVSAPHVAYLLLFPRRAAQPSSSTIESQESGCHFCSAILFRHRGHISANHDQPPPPSPITVIQEQMSWMAPVAAGIDSSTISHAASDERDVPACQLPTLTIRTDEAGMSLAPRGSCRRKPLVCAGCMGER
jgi:hypothetical protein